MANPLIRVGELDYIYVHGQLQKRRGSGFIKQYYDKDGYLKFHLCQKGKTYNIFVHAVVWRRWKGPVPNGMTIDHVNGDKSDNRIENLQLLTAAENSIKGNAKQWTIKDPEDRVWVIYNMEQFCREHELHPGHMRSVCNGEAYYLSHKGWTKP